MKYYLEKLIDKQNLSFSESYEAMINIIEKKYDEVSIAAFLTLLRAKGETAEEIAGFAKALKENCVAVESDEAIDVCGTGGDNSNSFNISTATAFVVAGAGVKVAKHGNKSVSSLSGSADVLSLLGININLNAEQAAKAINEIGIAFLFAPNFHPAMKIVAPIRKSLGIKTVFNVLGPLLNPANVKKQLVGVFNYEYAEKMKDAAKMLDKEKAIFICEENKYDEAFLSGQLKAFIYDKNNSNHTLELNYSDFGFSKVDPSNLAKANSEESAKTILSVLKDNKKDEAYNVVVANSALALLAADYSDSLKDCKQAAEESIMSGRAYQKFLQLKEFGEKYL